MTPRSRTNGPTLAMSLKWTAKDPETAHEMVRVLEDLMRGAQTCAPALPMWQVYWQTSSKGMEYGLTLWLEPDSLPF